MLLLALHWGLLMGECWVSSPSPRQSLFCGCSLRLCPRPTAVCFVLLPLGQILSYFKKRNISYLCHADGIKFAFNFSLTMFSTSLFLLNAQQNRRS